MHLFLQTSAKIVRDFVTREPFHLCFKKNLNHVFKFTDSSLTDAFTWWVLAFMVPFTGLANIKLLSKSFTLDPKDYWAQVKSLSHQMAAIQLSELCSKNPLKFNPTQITLQVQLSRYYFTYLYTLSQQVLVLKKSRIRQITMTYVLFSSNVNKLSRFFSSFFLLLKCVFFFFAELLSKTCWIIL